MFVNSDFMVTLRPEKGVAEQRDTTTCAVASKWFLVDLKFQPLL